MENARERLMVLLTEMFQLDQADLDFGIYRVMNHKREEVGAFLRAELLPTIERAFQSNLFADFARTKEKLKEATDAAFLAGFDPNESPKVKELRQSLQDQADPKALEAEVCSELVTFFARYYQGGDFVSRRRYKDGVYAIPYQGEEVKLHWANHDQYYIKSSERLSRYVFALPSTGRRVRFEVVAGSTEKDNGKAAQEKERRFALADPPWQVDGAELVLRFEYRAVAAPAEADGDEEGEAPEGAPRKRKGPTQAQCNEATAKALRAGASALGDWSAELLAAAPTDKQPERTVVEKHLERFTKRNDFDYFIHKDLRGFLRREFDVFVKNEIFHLDDVERQSFQRVEQALARVRVLREVAHKLIDFLAQLEEFQKTLWLKKKFVYDVSWCVTVDRVPRALWPEVLANEAQRREWVRLFAIDRIGRELFNGRSGDALTEDFLQAHPSLVVDTALFPKDFTWRLLASIDDLDANTTGVLVHGENFQALELMQARYGEKVDCVFMDPPYNTGGDGFAYKDGYRHSSWLTMLAQVMGSARPIVASSGAFFISIDANEHARLLQLLESFFAPEDILGSIVWKGATDNNPTRLAVEHEYIVTLLSDAASAPAVWTSPDQSAKELLLAHYEKLRAQTDSVDEIQRAFRAFIRDNREVLEPLTHYDRVDADGPYTGGRKVHNPNKDGYHYDVIHPDTGRPCKEPVRGYRYPESTMKEILEAGKIIFGEDDSQIIQIKEYLRDYEGALKSVMEIDSRVAANRLERLFKSREVFKNPKPVELIETLISYPCAKGGLVLDFFAGSGTTGDAALALRRRNIPMKFVLVESGAHFDTVLKPRILKAIHADEWKDGAPVTRKGLSAIVKVVRIESYEDALENLEPRRTVAQESLLAKAQPSFREKYFLQYMLRWETRGQGSLLDGAAFERPFDRTLRVTQGDEVRTVTVDLVETFNWLLGLTVKRIDRTGVVQTVLGALPDGRQALVVWRDVAAVDIDALDAWWKTSPHRASPELEVVYVNGPFGLATHRPEGSRWRVERTETEFLKRMVAATAD